MAMLLVIGMDRIGGKKKYLVITPQMPFIILCNIHIAVTAGIFVTKKITLFTYKGHKWKWDLELTPAAVSPEMKLFPGGHTCFAV